MATAEAVPEVADGAGYWYHVAAETVVVNGRTETRPAGIPANNQGWTANYLDDGTVVVRSPVPLLGVDTVSMSSAAALIADGQTKRPRGRILGR